MKSVQTLDDALYIFLKFQMLLWSVNEHILQPSGGQMLRELGSFACERKTILHIANEKSVDIR